MVGGVDGFIPNFLWTFFYNPDDEFRFPVYRDRQLVTHSAVIPKKDRTVIFGMQYH